ncbi:hypothetical protein SLEP1_g60196 [Rubroshorea leprosula]|uniref:Uncharacterized protein n=1 Tax=Rubroshorea leprosula TaxID=152421 RepID=A0AAV5MVW0_9ROSI|nr:hypothetical protein SLEP1_g60196 [Rubroshorea leprosula]
MVDYHPLEKLGDDMAEQSTCRFPFQTKIIKSCISQLGRVDYHLLEKLGDDMAEQST